MKVILAALAVFALAAPAAAETRTIDVPSFNAIRASGPYLVEYARGDTVSVTVEGASRDLERLRIWVADGALRVKQNCTFFCGSRGPHRAVIRVTSPSLEALSAAMGLTARAQGVRATDFRLNVSMGASARIAGTCGTLSADVSMGGVIDAENFACQNVSIDASMGGSADVFAAQSVHADASMGGDVNVAGAPGRRTSGTSMGGSISID